jgi:hypothetical protein
VETIADLDLDGSSTKAPMNPAVRSAAPDDLTREDEPKQRRAGRPAA